MLRIKVNCNTCKYYIVRIIHLPGSTTVIINLAVRSILSDSDIATKTVKPSVIVALTVTSNDDSLIVSKLEDDPNRFSDSLSALLRARLKPILVTLEPGIVVTLVINWTV